LDRRLLGVLCAHRVVTQEQLGRLFPSTPERTLRYRTRRLHDLGLAGRTRPYRDRGSAPNHHWPTRRADCLMRGDPAPGGGERRQPNPVFLAHAAALTELYVAVATQAGAAGLSFLGYRREGDAREPFRHEGKERALAPDALLAFADAEGRELRAFVELDLGTMSHTRLRQKAELYAAYTASDAWRGRHLFLPALLFLTTTDTRAAKFLEALARQLAYGPRRHGRRPLVAGAAGIAWTPDRLLTDPCLANLDGNTSLTLAEVLGAARAPYEQARARQLAQQAAEEEQRRVLREDPEAMRKYLADRGYNLSSYVQALDELGEQTIELLRHSTGVLSLQERDALQAIARDLDQALPQPSTHALPPPDSAARSEIAKLSAHYRARQAEHVEALAAQHGAGPSLYRAQRLLDNGGLLKRLALAQLSRDATDDATSRREQQNHYRAYTVWREQTARQHARKAGPLGRLTHRPEDFYPQIDQRSLGLCRHCSAVVYPAIEAGDYLENKPACHYCHSTEHIVPYRKRTTSYEGEQRR
jgi:hypothetical protein